LRCRDEPPWIRRTRDLISSGGKIMMLDTEVRNSSRKSPNEEAVRRMMKVDPFSADVLMKALDSQGYLSGRQAVENRS